MWFSVLLTFCFILVSCHRKIDFCYLYYYTIFFNNIFQNKYIKMEYKAFLHAVTQKCYSSNVQHNYFAFKMR